MANMPAHHHQHRSRHASGQAHLAEGGMAYNATRRGLLHLRSLLLPPLVVLSLFQLLAVAMGRDVLPTDPGAPCNLSPILLLPSSSLRPPTVPSIET